MKIEDIKIVLSKDVHQAGESIDGQIVVKTSACDKWPDNGKALIKFYDDLNMEWQANEMVGIYGVTRHLYYNKQRPYKLNQSTILDKNNLTRAKHEENVFYYSFKFQLPDRLLGTIDINHARSKYFIKCYLSNDDETLRHYIEDVNVFNEFFKSLNHTYCKKEIIIHNKLAPLEITNKEDLRFEAKSSLFKVEVVIPKNVFSRGETIKIHALVESNDDEVLSEMHKISFKLLQLVKLKALNPIPRTTLFENLIVHQKRKNIHHNVENGIVLEEYLQIPKEILSTSSRQPMTYFSYDTINPLIEVNPIRINYKLSIEFWKHFFYSELEINVPLIIDPEF
jgi:hypothetical protein